MIALIRSVFIVAVCVLAMVALSLLITDPRGFLLTLGL